MNRVAAIGSITLTLASALTLTACGGSGGAGVAANAKQTLTVWAMGTEGEKLGDVAKEYEKTHSNIDVKVTPVGWDVAHQKLVAAAAAGKLPDVVQMGSSYLGEFADMGVLEPVDTKTFHQGDFFPAAWQQGSYDGKTYSVPWYVDTRVLYYRTDLAKKAGIKAAPTTMAELQQDAEAYQSKAHTKWGMDLKPSGLDTVQSFYPFLYSDGGGILNAQGKPVIDSPQAVKALDYYGSFFKKGLIAKSEQPGYDVTKDFNTGNVPMFLGGPWMTGLIADNYPGLKGKWAVAPLPAGDKGSVSMAGGSSLAVSADSTHKAAASKFIQYLTGAKGQADWFKRTADLPANRAAWDSGTLATDAEMKIWRKQMETARTEPSAAKLTEITSKVDAAIGAVTQGSADAKTALTQAQNQIAGLTK
ncbi:sugar ABC transporter substrate-binding protein [Streptomyces sp. J2-1]|uniref:sugar ABC transporter substrate-binding protein n=1 Tax=Streptomyces corallincola TaxID=2851888 RepID=UPI001C384525|nr:sugar ABC transporter substrate-binding protein [Streptomyces corallincola]MBV2355446.1 sugar ABC transporter substrate-binding protein [Streptomyces corallincola]